MQIIANMSLMWSIAPDIIQKMQTQRNSEQMPVAIGRKSRIRHWTARH